MVRRNGAGRIYGITFIDHNSKTIWNGSRLGKGFSANVFNNCWNHDISPEIKESNQPYLRVTPSQTEEELPAEKNHELFDFLNMSGTDETDIIESLGGLLPEALGEDYEDQEFANRMKKKKKKRKRKQ